MGEKRKGYDGDTKQRRSKKEGALTKGRGRKGGEILATLAKTGRRLEILQAEHREKPIYLKQGG